MTGQSSDFIGNAHQTLLQHKGRTFRRDLGVIRELDLLRFRMAIAGMQHWDSASRSAEEGPAVAHPIYLSAVVGWDAGPPEEALLADGTPAEAMANLPLNGLRLMGGGQSIEIHRPLVSGMHIVQHTQVLDVRLKEGRQGPLLLIDIERQFLHCDERVLSCRDLYIGR